MGRTLKRVPLDFNWPLNTVWGGYLNPHARQSSKCDDCDGSGYAPMAKLFNDQWYGEAPFDPVEYGASPLRRDSPLLAEVARRNVERSPDYYGTGEASIARETDRLWRLWRGQWCHHLIQADVDALVQDDRLWDFTRVPKTPEQAEIVAAKIAAGENSWLPFNNGYIPTAAEVNEWSILGMGHDGSNAYTCVKARCKREGVDLMCPTCHGDGCLWPPGIEELYEAWKPTEPPAGEGYQLWSTTSEGEPISPVFDSLDQLCEYASVNCTTFGYNKTTAERWKEMLESDFVHHQDGNMIFM